MNTYARRELDPPPRPLKRGERDYTWKVKQVQEWLCLHGHHTAVDGDFGPATEAALKAFQNHMPQKYTPEPVAWGVVDAETWTALTFPLWNAANWTRDGLLLSRAIVHLAETYLSWGVREVGKPNGGPWVRYYCRDQEVPWCAGFVTTVLGQALGHDDLFTLSCDVLARKAPQNALRAHVTSGRAGIVKPGDLFLIRRETGDWIHTGIVTAVHAEHFETIEGNTNTDGSREGTAVHARRRAFGPNVDFVLTGGER